MRLPIPQHRLDYLELPGPTETGEGAIIDLYTDVGGDVDHWTAHLHHTEGVFDERSRVLYAVARIDDPYSLQRPGGEPLRIGTFVNANIEGKELKGIVPLPRYVLRAGDLVWVVDDRMRLRNRKVTLLSTGGDRIYVSSGLNEGDLVSLTTLDNSFDGSEVAIESSTPSNLLDKSGIPIPAKDRPTAEVTAAAQPAQTDSSDG